MAKFKIMESGKVYELSVYDAKNNDIMPTLLEESGVDYGVPAEWSADRDVCDFRVGGGGFGYLVEKYEGENCYTDYGE